MVHLKGGVRGDDVRGGVKVAILAPNWGVRRAVKSPRQLGGGLKAHDDLFAELIDPKTPLEDDDLARVASDARGLEIEDRAVLWAQRNCAGFHP